MKIRDAEDRRHAAHQAGLALQVLDHVTQDQLTLKLIGHPSPQPDALFTFRISSLKLKRSTGLGVGVPRVPMSRSARGVGREGRGAHVGITTDYKRYRIYNPHIPSSRALLGYYYP